MEAGTRVRMVEDPNKEYGHAFVGEEGTVLGPYEQHDIDGFDYNVWPDTRTREAGWLIQPGDPGFTNDNGVPFYATELEVI